MSEVDTALVPPSGIDRAEPGLAQAIAEDRSAFKLLRNFGPVFQDTQGAYCVTTPTGCQYVFRHPEIFSSVDAYDFEQTSFKLIPIAVDPPKHAEYRRALGDSFAPRRVTALESDLRRQVNELIDDFIDEGRCEIISQLAGLFPTQVFLSLFGIPLEHRDKFNRWNMLLSTHEDMTVKQGEGSSAVQQASGELTDYIRDLITERRQNPTDDIFGRVVALSGDEAWTDDELLGFGFIFLIAGLETVAASIGFLFRYLAEHPDIRERVIEDETALDRLIEEILRLETVSPQAPRVSVVDSVVEGYRIPAGSVVFPMIGVANRDPVMFPNPDEVDLARTDKGHFTFGLGAHRCIGSHLARSEMKILTQEFHKRISDYSLIGDRPLVHWPSGAIKYAALEVAFEPGGNDARPGN